MQVKNLVGKIFSRGPVSVVLAVVLAVVVVTASVGAATTISTNITTGGTLTVTGASSFAADLSVGGYATTTAASGLFTTNGGLTVKGNTSLGDAASDTLTIVANASTTNSLTVAQNFYVAGRATTTAATGDIATVGSLTVGPSGSAMAQIIKGTCNLLGMDAVHAASTTKPYNCAVTGVVSGDVVIAQFATTTAQGLAQSWIIVGSKASTTAGFIDVLVWHDGNVVAPSTLGVGSSTQYIIIR